MHQGGVNSLALALTAAFCGANQHNHGLLVSWALQGEGSKMKCSSVFTSTTNHVFTFERVTLCTIILMHKDTGQQYVVIFTDNNKIRDYKAGIVPQFGELKQSDVDLVLFYRDEYEKYFDSLKDGDECLSFKDFIECLC
ncbi:hypothetical protein [Escherichia coli]|uniref:hypothetical protein n=1 Tax=Escherichia coli TaxID=562 RepID=UPI00202379A2|nr:hypothetical protein [Escherichia coli]